jgi:hypothetical protein
LLFLPLLSRLARPPAVSTSSPLVVWVGPEKKVLEFDPAGCRRVERGVVIHIRKANHSRTSVAGASTHRRPRPRPAAA